MAIKPLKFEQATPKAAFTVTYNAWDDEDEEEVVVHEIVEAESAEDAISVIIAETGTHAKAITEVSWIGHAICRRGSNKKRGS